MNFWNCIGEILLFRWLKGLFSSHKSGESANEQFFADDFHDYYSEEQSFDFFDEEQDDYDMMDDF